MFLEWSCTDHMNFVQNTDLIGGHGNQKAKFSREKKKIKKQ